MEKQSLSDLRVASFGSISWAHARLRERSQEELSPIVVQALEFAEAAHSAQRREALAGLTPPPYFVHPVEVARLCLDLRDEAGLTEPAVDILICAAILHDTVEDCPVSATDLEANFGLEVTALVLALTKPRLREREIPETRSRRFARQIVSAGPSAVFVKCCDLLHNLAEPESTPRAVLDRAVSKGRAHYLPMLDRVPLHPAFRQRLEGAISQVESHISALPEMTRESEGWQDRLLRVLAVAKTGKTELRDAVQFFGDTFCGGRAAVVRFPRVGPAVIEGSSLNVALDTGRLASIRKTTRDRGGFGRLANRLFRQKAADKVDSDAYFACCEHGLDGGEILFVCSLPPDVRSDSERRAAVAIVVRLLLAAVAQSSAALYHDLAEEALGLGLELDLSLAMEVGVQRGQLNNLLRWRQDCASACEVVISELQFFLREQKQRDRLWHRVRIEQRVKSSASILDAFARKPKLSWPNLAVVEDVAGVRVVCPTQRHVEELAAFLIEGNAERPLLGPIRRFDGNPTIAGYRGVHAIRAITLPSQLAIVPCEVQLRTVLQDAWANVSHMVAYKESRVSAERYAADLRRLSQHLADCETIMTDIFDQHAMERST